MIPMPDRDKLAHYFYGTIAGTSVIVIDMYAALLVLAVAGGKEAIDRVRKGRFSGYDVIWTVAGGNLTVAVWYFATL